jgi:RNA polymerase sigma factor (sigma-70 family)
VSAVKLKLIEGGKSSRERFETLVRPHYMTLYRIAYRLTRSSHDAEDLVQEVCVRAYGRLDEMAGLDNPRAWLICVLRRLFIDQTRRYERANVDSLETVDADRLVSDLPGLLEEAEQAARRQWLDRAWRRLDPEQRSLLALHDVEGYSLAEINEITGLKQGTLKSRLHRARVKLGRYLRHEEGSVTVPSHELGAVR